MTSTPTTEPVDLFSAELLADPYAGYSRLREQAPVLTASMMGGPPLWLVTRYDDVRTVLTDPRFANDASRAGGPDIREAMMRRLGLDGEEADYLSQSILNFDGADHTRLRKLVSRAFTVRRVADLRPRVEQITAELLDDALERGEVDLLTALAEPLPVRVISEMLGVPAADHDRFAAWSHAMARGTDPAFLLSEEQQARIRTAREQYVDYFRELTAQRRRHPGEDLLSALVSVSDAGDTLTENELLVTCTLLLTAGHETTVNLIGNGTLALLRHPDQLAALRADPGIVETAVEELLRYDSPVQLTARQALSDTVVGDVEVSAGTVALILVGAANRDPAAHPDPDRLDLTRPPSRHLAFGQGIHFCLGAPLARAEGRIALRELTRRAPGLRATGEPEWKENITLRGMARLPVALG